ncbi:hypothetical protein Tco_1037051 [Tanacetum coccineum]
MGLWYMNTFWSYNIDGVIHGFVTKFLECYKPKVAGLYQLFNKFARSIIDDVLIQKPSLLSRFKNERFVELLGGLQPNLGGFLHTIFITYLRLRKHFCGQLSLFATIYVEAVKRTYEIKGRKLTSPLAIFVGYVSDIGRDDVGGEHFGVLYGDINGKMFVINMLKPSLMSGLSGSLFFDGEQRIRQSRSEENDECKKGVAATTSIYNKIEMKSAIWEH